MKPELMAEYMRKRREKLKELYVKDSVNAQPEPKKEEKVNASSPVTEVATIPSWKVNTLGIKDPDLFKGAFEPEYYQTVCIYCGSPKTTLVKRNGFLGHLCESHNPNLLPKPDSL